MTQQIIRVMTTQVRQFSNGRSRFPVLLPGLGDRAMVVKPVRARPSRLHSRECLRPQPRCHIRRVDVFWF